MSNRTVLTVEDDPAIRRGVVDALRFVGFNVLQAGHGDLGLEMAVRQAYDLLLLDLVLPGKSGLDILRAVMRSAAHAAGHRAHRTWRRGRPRRGPAGRGRRLRRQAV